jgi:hypothetical protein
LARRSIGVQNCVHPQSQEKPDMAAENLAPEHRRPQPGIDRERLF